jgi:hypothetical protein
MKPTYVYQPPKPWPRMMRTLTHPTTTVTKTIRGTGLSVHLNGTRHCNVFLYVASDVSDTNLRQSSCG